MTIMTTRPDDRFYWVQDLSDGTFDVSPKLLDDREEVDQDGNPKYEKVWDEATQSMVDSAQRMITRGLKFQWVDQVKETTNRMLEQTDWYVVRKADIGTAIPDAVNTYRAAIRAESNRLVDAITATTSVEDLIQVVMNQAWPQAVRP
jgi:hypothetical protein